MEKSLKAWLTWHDAEFRFTHNIEILLKTCEEIDGQFEQLRAAETLTAYAVGIRYPDGVPMPTEEEMREAVGIARETWDFVLAKLAAAGLEFDEGT